VLILRLAAVALCILMLGGCVRDDQAAHEPSAKDQKVIPDKGSKSDAALNKDMQDQKAVEQDEATSKS
jgi:hypothetical protein